MNPEAWQRVKAVFDTALSLPPEDRASFLDSECGTDAKLRLEIESLLAAAESGDSFLGSAAQSEATSHEIPRSLIAPEQMVGRYRVLSHLASGGMGDVYLAEDPRLGRRVALKLLPRTLSQDPARLQRFEREARTASQLAHPNVCVIYEIADTPDGRRFIAMEYVEGESLRDVLNRHQTAGTRMALDEVLEFALQMAAGLAAAHEAGIVHRDIKPENVMRRRDGLVKVLDFGLAKLVERPAGPSRSSKPSTVRTEAGTVLGTVQYMSPEQARGLPVDERTDVWSLGVVLYEMLAGRPPFEGETGVDVMVSILDRVPTPLAELAPVLPGELQQIVERTLSKDQEGRFATIGEFASALARLRRRKELDRHTKAATRAKAHLRWRSARAAAVLAVVVSAGALLGVWRYRRAPAAATPDVVRLAVLPFENLGASTEDYLANGMAEALRGKLSAVPGLQVTSRRSSSQYAGTSKTPQDIGRELGVQYLLRARVRWDQDDRRTKRLHVSPELVHVASAATTWKQSFDVPPTDVFRVQASVAQRVVQTLRVSLSDSARRRLAEWPTQNLAAYDAFLKGNQASTRQAVAYHEQAVRLDSTFAEAWGELSMTLSDLYFNHSPTTAVAQQARQAAEKALALAQNRAYGHRALGWYHWAVTKDYERAAEDYARGLAIAPNDVSLLTDAALAEQNLGLWTVALARLQRAQALDARSVGTAFHLANCLLMLRRYPEAQETSDRALSIAPTYLHALRVRVMTALAQGDLARARAVIAAVPKEVEPAELLAYLAVADDMYWVLDDAQQEHLLRLSPSDFGDDRGTWAIVLTQTHWLRGARAKARAYADSARTAFEQQLGAGPEDPQRHIFLGLLLAYLGRKTEAIQEGQRAVALLPIGKSANHGAYLQHQLGRIYVLVGEPEKALNQLEPLLKIPYYLSPGWLKIDPSFDPLRSNPRFQRMVAGGE